MKRLLCFFSICLVLVGSSFGATISYWQNSEYQGEQSALDMAGGVCYNSGYWNDKISSIDTRGACVILYEHSNCNSGNGRSLRVAPGTPCHNWLGGCGLNFNDIASSIKLC